MTGGVAIRPGTVADTPAVLALLDGAVAWLVARGRTGQWGSDPFSADPRRHEMVTSWADAGGLYVADIDGAVAGALAVGAAPPYVPSVAEPELYVNLLVTDRHRAGAGIGAALLRWAEDAARERGLALLRVDCYRGDDRALVRYYERQGFVATVPFTVNLPAGPWPGQVLERRLA
jgi:GNAT superfamily N-acetyltransferase